MDKIVEFEFWTDLSQHDAPSRMEGLFAKYLTLLRRNSLSLVIKNNPRIAVKHVCDAIRPMVLRKQIESDSRFAHAKLRKNIMTFPLHAIRLAKAFQLTDKGKHFGPDSDVTRNKRKPTKTRKSGKLANAGGFLRASEEETRNRETISKPAPVCL